mgnify:CR=1 FL=1
MAERPIICVGDTTTHGGTVLEGFANFEVYGRLASGKGHKVRCPRCKGIFVIIEGAENRTVGDVPLALEGMLTSCGAALVASQRAATAETGSTAAQAVPLSAGSSGMTKAKVVNRRMVLIKSLNNGLPWKTPKETPSVATNTTSSKRPPDTLMRSICPAAKR